MLAAEVHDVPDAVTRFVVVSRPGPVPAATGADRTSLVAFLREDHPGALMEMLTEFAVRGINLTRIESRPTGDGLGKYCFSIDCEGHLDDARVGEALMGLRRVCADVRFLGSYPRRDGGRTQVRRGTSDAEFAQAAAWLGAPALRPRLTRPWPDPARQGRWPLQVRARGPARLRCFFGSAGPGHHAGRQRPAHLLELRPGGHLLGEQRGLDAVEQALQPADQLGLRDPQLGLAGRVVLGERQREPLELLDQLGGQAVLELLDRAPVDLAPACARLFSSSGAALTSSSSCRIMLPIRITLAGCSTISITGRSPCSPSPPSMAMPSGPTTTMLLGSACWFACSLIVLVCPLPDSGRAGGGPDLASADERQDRAGRRLVRAAAPMGCSWPE